jgi:hypothetical protein
MIRNDFKGRMLCFTLNFFINVSLYTKGSYSVC